MSSETALYTRVSTDDQNLARQKEETWTYAVEQLDLPSSEISVYQDKGTGRDTLRDDYQALMRRVRAGKVEPGDRARGLSSEPIHARPRAHC